MDLMQNPNLFHSFDLFFAKHQSLVLYDIEVSCIDSFRDYMLSGIARVLNLRIKGEKSFR